MSSNPSIKTWLKAARLRTLPLALSGILLGSFFASHKNVFRWEVFFLSIFTAIGLQVLSNFANDYGDFSKGTDLGRKDRTMASGGITVSQMKKALFLTAIVTLILGVSLIYISFSNLNLTGLLFLLLGIAAIGAAIGYTMGKNAYGYRGLGDIMVFIFFGLVSVVGVFFLHQGEISTFHPESIWLGSTIGFLSVGVLNVNNIRDIKGDQSNNKMTVPVTIGRKKAEFYQLLLLVLAFGCLAIFVVRFAHKGYSSLFLIPLFLFHWFKLISIDDLDRNAYNSQLKMLSLSTLVLTLVIGLLIY